MDPLFIPFRSRAVSCFAMEIWSPTLLFSLSSKTLSTLRFEFLLISSINTYTHTKQSRNWDGGKQEYNSALTALRKVFPDADVVENCVDKYPIRVIVTAQKDSSPPGKNPTEIWSGRQQDLFSKYASKRKKAMEAIENNLSSYKSKL